MLLRPSSQFALVIAMQQFMLAVLVAALVIGSTLTSLNTLEEAFADISDSNQHKEMGPAFRLRHLPQWRLSVDPLMGCQAYCMGTALTNPT
eukprot:135823-Amphidinium_carterae.2